jgi:glucokinase
MTTLLAGDIGGTKTILSLYSNHQGRLEKRAERRFVSAEWDDLAPMVHQFLADPHGEGSPDGAAPEPPAAACFAVAGPVQAGRARLTNLPWQLDEVALARACAIPRVELVNDFAVLIYGLPHLAADQQAPIRAGTADPAAPVLILGAGTGLGVAIGIPTAGGLQAVAS